MGGRNKPKLKTRYELLRVEFDVNPETGNIEVSLEFDAINRTSKSSILKWPPF